MQLRPVFICEAVRTPFGRLGGALSSVRADDLAASALRALLQRCPDLDPAAIDDVVMGCANQAGEDNRNVARMALLLAGLPVTVPGVTVNRLCGSGLDAVAYAARTIATGEADVMIAGGVESMTRAPYILAKSDERWSRSARLEDTTLGWRLINPRMQELYGVDSMPQTAESVAREYAISREAQDAFALRSQERCAAAQASGGFVRELCPVTVTLPRAATQVFAVDEHPRPDSTASGLAALRPIVCADGTITAGNSSGLNDGSGALLLATETAATRHGLRPLARVSAAATAGVPPRVMGMGPLPAIRRLLERTQYPLRDFSVLEINEAFAAQVLAVLRGLEIADDDPRVNPQGGAIALGHPLGASGARLAATATFQLQRGGARLALCAMCIGVGQGIALSLERV